MTNPKPAPHASFWRKAIWFARHRPGRIWAHLRTLRTFWVSRQLYRWLPHPGIELGHNVRVQRFGTLMAEAPNARIRLGAHSLVFEKALLEAYDQGSIEIGDSAILSDVRIYSRGKVRIGHRFLGSWNLFVQDYSPHPTQAATRALQTEWSTRLFSPTWATAEERRLAPLNWDFSPGEIIIGDDVWVGAQCVILKNAHIGSGCIVAAGSVVTAGDYPPNSLLAGNPAKVIKDLST